MDQHQNKVAVQKCPHHPSSSVDLPVEPLNHIVSVDLPPVLKGELAIGQRFLNTIPRLLGGLFQLLFPLIEPLQLLLSLKRLFCSPGYGVL